MTDTFDDREVVKRLLSAMSDRMTGAADDAFVTPESLMPIVDVDTPDPPMQPEDQQTPQHENRQASRRARAGSSRYAWGGFENGRIPASQLHTIGGGHRLEASAAEAWLAMVKAAAADGINLTLTDSYRSYDAQVDVRRRKGDQVATATPGTSVHGWGRAVDANVNDPDVLAWLRANAARFGWVNPEWAQKPGKGHEPWHYEWQGAGNG